MPHTRAELQAMDAQISLARSMEKMVDLQGQISEILAQSTGSVAEVMESLADSISDIKHSLREIKDNLASLAENMSEMQNHQWRRTIGAARPAFKGDGDDAA